MVLEMEIYFFPGARFKRRAVTYFPECLTNPWLMHIRVHIFLCYSDFVLNGNNRCVVAVLMSFPIDILLLFFRLKSHTKNLRCSNVGNLGNYLCAFAT